MAQAIDTKDTAESVVYLKSLDPQVHGIQDVLGAGDQLEVQLYNYRTKLTRFVMLAHTQPVKDAMADLYI